MDQDPFIMRFYTIHVFLSIVWWYKKKVLGLRSIYAIKLLLIEVFIWRNDFCKWK